MTSGFRFNVSPSSVNLPLLELLPQTGGRVLDCGCGNGSTARVLTSRGWKVTGFTLRTSEREIASKYCDRVLVGDLNRGLPEAAGCGYDIVLMSHILEHLVEPEKLLQDAKKALAPNGMIAVAFPNVCAYPVRFRFLFGKFQYSVGGILEKTHLRFYTFTTGAELLRSNGFEILVARADGAFPLWKLRAILPPSFVKGLNLWVCRLWPGLFGFQNMYLARPGPITFEGRDSVSVQD